MYEHFVRMIIHTRMWLQKWLFIKQNQRLHIKNIEYVHIDIYDDIKT